MAKLWRVLVVGSLMLVVAAGCSGGDSFETSTVRGAVTLGGKPIPDDAESYIRFSSTAVPDASAVSVPITSGRYEVDGVPQGEVTVTFNIVRYGPEKVSERTGESFREQVNLLPPKAAAGLQFTVSGETVEKDFRL